MSSDDEFGDDCFCCFECGAQFHTPVYSIIQEFERTEFFDGDRLPEVSIRGAMEIANCCSLACLAKQREKILLAENLRATYPDIGPLERCSRCGAEVDTTKFHQAWVEEMAVCQPGVSLSFHPQEINTLALLCLSCCPNS